MTSMGRLTRKTIRCRRRLGGKVLVMHPVSLYKQTALRVSISVWGTAENLIFETTYLSPREARAVAAALLKAAAETEAMA